MLLEQTTLARNTSPMTTRTNYDHRACTLGRPKKKKHTHTEQGFAIKKHQLEALGRFVDLVNCSSAARYRWSAFRQFIFNFLRVVICVMVLC